MEEYNSKEGEKVHRGWLNYFRKPPPKTAPKVIRDIHTLVVYINYLTEINKYLLNQKEPVWHFNSAFLGFGLGIGVTLIFLWLT